MHIIINPKIVVTMTKCYPMILTKNGCFKRIFGMYYINESGVTLRLFLNIKDEPTYKVGNWYKNYRVTNVMTSKKKIIVEILIKLREFTSDNFLSHITIVSQNIISI